MLIIVTRNWGPPQIFTKPKVVWHLIIASGLSAASTTGTGAHLIQDSGISSMLILLMIEILRYPRHSMYTIPPELL